MLSSHPHRLPTDQSLQEMIAILSETFHDRDETLMKDLRGIRKLAMEELRAAT